MTKKHATIEQIDGNDDADSDCGERFELFGCQEGTPRWKSPILPLSQETSYINSILPYLLP